MKSEKGITLTILIITIVVMSIIAGTITYEYVNNFEKQKLSKLYNDLSLLDDKISVYYLKYGTIPVKEEFTGSDDFKSVKNDNDGDIYYVIDLSKIDNLTLNISITGIGDDVYIINDETHTIYYPKGMEIDGETYYKLP